MSTHQRPRSLMAGALVAAGGVLIGLAAGYTAQGSTPPGVSPLATSAPSSDMPASSSAPLDEDTDLDSGSAIAGGVDFAFAAQYPFYGEHQAGVETPAALHQSFLGFDLRKASRANAESVLILLTDDAARLMNGEPALGDLEPEIAKRPAGLTITVGLGRGFYAAAKAPAPEQLRDIPRFSTDRLDPRWGQTDLVVQIGSNDPLSLSHASRMIVKDLSSLTELKWRQDGFRSGADLIPGYDEPRNLIGQVDGIVNPEVGTEEFDDVVWVDSDDPASNSGTVLVLRRIRILTDTWDQLDPATQDRVMGRERDTGAPVGGKPGEDLDFDAVDKDGLPVVDANAHARVSHAGSTEAMIYRRPYNYDAGPNARGKGVDVGQLFAAYTRDPAKSFLPMQERISKLDAFNEWNTTTGSSTYFILPGVEEGEYLGQELFS